MFKSKVRAINVPQYEHGRLAGTVARAWGNDAFDCPALDFDAFVAGVTLHDWGYGVIDNLPIGAAPEDEWLEVIRKGVEKRFEHPTTDIVVKLHIRRLLSFYSSPEREAFIEQIDQRIADRLRAANARGATQVATKSHFVRNRFRETVFAREIEHIGAAQYQDAVIKRIQRLEVTLFLPDPDRLNRFIEYVAQEQCTFRPMSA